MPQLDIDLIEDFIVFGFVAFVFGFSDDGSEDKVIHFGSDLHLAHYYISIVKKLDAQSKLVAGSSAVVYRI
jgi:hypothetical protein